MRYSFSGHESFQCKSLWLKKGYDYLLAGGKFNDADSVVKLGVGKNMVASIRFWLRAFRLTTADELTPLANYIFNNDNGRDKFTEDINTLWILHYLLVKSGIASIYNLLFLEYQREKKEFSKSELQTFIKRKCSVPEQKNVYNENTVKKDIGVLLKNYIAPTDLKAIEDFSALLLDLNLINRRKQDNSEHESYVFRQVKNSEISDEVFLFALIDYSNEDKTLSLDKLQALALIFCMPLPDLIEAIKRIESRYSRSIVFTDNSGVKNVQLLAELEPSTILDSYYNAV